MSAKFFNVRQGLNLGTRATDPSDGRAGSFYYNTATAKLRIYGTSWGDVGGGTTSPLTTKGDLYGFDTANARIPVGRDGQRVIADSTQTAGIRYQSAENKNNILNKDAETDTTGWATYFNTAANIPSNGTGGTATGLTFARSATAPLRDVASFLLTQANSTSLQGKGVSYDFTIDSADQAKQHSISFDYNASSTFIASDGKTAPLGDGTTTTNAGNSDIQVFLYDKTNAILIPVSTPTINSNGANNFTFNGSFTTNANSTSYRLIFHVTTTSANATGWAFKFDNVYVGRMGFGLVPGVAPFQNEIVLDTGNGYGSSATAVRRFANVRLNVGTAMTLNQSSSAGDSITVTTPGIYLIHSSDFDSSGSWQSGVTINGSSLTSNAGNLSYANGKRTAFLYPQNVFAGATIGLFLSAGDVIRVQGNSGGTTDNVILHVTQIPTFTGLPGNNVSGAVEAAYYIGASVSNTVSTTVPINFDTKIYDTLGCVTVSNTAWRFTAPIAGFYLINMYCSETASGGEFLSVYKNGVVYQTLAANLTQNLYYYGGSMKVQLAAGDYVDIRPSTTSYNGQTFNGLAGANGLLTTSHIEISLTSTTVGAASSSDVPVNCSYVLANTISVGSNSPVKFDTKFHDSHNAYNPTTGLYTLPVSGRYRFTVISETNSGGQTLLYKNGASVLYLTSHGTGTVVSGSFTMEGKAGDTFSFNTDNAVNYNGGTPYQNAMSIEKVG